MGGKVLEYEAKTILNKGREEGIIFAARIFQEAKRNPDYTKEEVAAKVGCTVKEVEDTLKMFGM